MQTITNYLLPPPPRVADLTDEINPRIISDTWYKYFSLLRLQVNDIVNVPTNLTIKDVYTSYSVLVTDNVISGYANAGPFVVTLPDAPTSGMQVTVHKGDITGNDIVVNGNGLNIGNSASYTLSNYDDVITLVYDADAQQGAHWIIISSTGAEYFVTVNNGPEIANSVNFASSATVAVSQNGHNVSPSLLPVGDDGTYTKVTTDLYGRVISGNTATLASSDFAGQGLTTQMLHGGGTENPSWTSLDLKNDSIVEQLQPGNFPVITGDVYHHYSPVSLNVYLNEVNSNIGKFGDAGNVAQITVNAKGLVTSVANVQTYAITELNGDVIAGPGPGNVTAVLATINSNVGTFGSNVTIPVITVNAKGLITAITTANASSSSGSVLLAELYNPVAVGGILICSKYDPMEV